MKAFFTGSYGAVEIRTGVQSVVQLPEFATR